MVEPTRIKPVISTLGAIIALALAGCTSLVPEQGNTNRFSLKVDSGEEKVVETDLGLALSGGGVRSAMFNLGVLKWLYDAKLLDQVDIISSVSGGGYTAYWMYANHFGQPNVPRFGYGSFDQSRFSQHACNILTTSNFVTLKDMGEAMLLPNLTAPQMYERELADTFGRMDRHDKPLDVGSLAHAPEGSPRIPYYVINTTIVDPVPSKGWADGRLELTPLLKGNESAGYTPWGDSERVPLRKAIAISGAAFRPFLKQQIANPVSGIPQPEIVLSDGGHSENLGAIALIRRGVKKVIIADAEHNPRYEFTAYRNLQSRLAKWGLALTVPTIDGYIEQAGLGLNRPPLQTGLHTGTVVDADTGKPVSDIYYLKMARADSITALLEDRGAIKAGEDVNKAFYTRLEETKKTSNLLFQPYVWQCDTAIDLSREMTRNWFKYELSRYIKAADGSAWLSILRRIPYDFDFLYSDFPQYSTADQSFNLTQAMAFVALGYYEAEELESKVQEIVAKPTL